MKVRIPASPCMGYVLNAGLFQGNDLKDGIFTNSTGEWKVIKGTIFLNYNEVRGVAVWNRILENSQNH